MIFKNLLLVVFACFLFACSSNTTDNGGNKPTDSTTTAAENSKVEKRKTIVFFGNSLTYGYGLQTPARDGFVALLQQRLDSLDLPYKAVNAGLSGETTAAGKERVSWVLRQPVDIFVLELGGNDALRGVETAVAKSNLDAIITTVKEKYPDAKIILAGMQAPPNMGERYTKEFSGMYQELAEKHGTALIPFFLENVGGVAELNQGDRIHPNEEGQKILLENVWEVLKKEL